MNERPTGPDRPAEAARPTDTARTDAARTDGAPTDGIRTGQAPRIDPRLDDDALGRIVRDVADGWTMPPRRLGLATWRDRVDVKPRHGSGGVGRRGLRGLGAAASIALAATVVLAFAAVLLTVPRGSSIGKAPGSGGPAASAGLASPRPSGGPSGPASPAPAASPGPSGIADGPLPAYAVYGSKLSGRVVARFGASYGAVDLGSGALRGDLFPGTTWGTQLFHLPGGGLLCVCQRWSSTNFVQGTLVVDIRRTDPDGSIGDRFPVASLVGDADPGDAATYDFPGAVATADLSADGRTAYVAWAYRRSPTWHIGIDVVDVARGAVTQTLRLPDRPSLDGGKPIDVVPSTARISPDGAHLMVIVGESTANDASVQATYVSATVADGRISGVETLPTGSGGTDPCAYSLTAGWASADAFYTVCGVDPSTYILMNPGGTVLVRTAVGGGGPSVETVSGGSEVVDPAAGLLYHWDPVSRTLTRLDLGTGSITGTVTAAATSASEAPGAADAGRFDLGGIGRAIAGWLAPSANAKTLLQPGLALSPDGTRVYALGILPPQNYISGSTGVDVFDTTSMRQVDHWAPLGDLVSIAVSSDGRQVYLVASAATTAAGGATDAPGALFVYDAPNGRLHLIAGDLGQDDVELRP
ncbi:MAG: hypothetical protein ACHQ3P_05340 [Candidatus Limnocylindrales bacterium]